jgi:hypothetical protein
MKLLLTALLFLPRAALWAQQPQVMLTDSSRIETRWYPGGREVQEILTRKDRVHYRFYRNNRAQATTTSTYTKAERAVGITREYFDDGRLRYAIDHDRGRVVVAHEPVDAHQALRHAMKARADRFVAARYGDHFLRYQAVWNVRSTYLFNTVTGGGWTDRFGERPHTFKFCYDVKLDPAHVYPELLVFALDTLGRLIPDEFEFEEAYGFEFVGPRLWLGLRAGPPHRAAKKWRHHWPAGGRVAVGARPAPVAVYPHPLHGPVSLRCAGPHRRPPRPTPKRPLPDHGLLRRVLLQPLDGRIRRQASDGNGQGMGKKQRLQQRLATPEMNAPEENA